MCIRDREYSDAASFISKCGGRLFTDRLCNSVTATDASWLQAVGNAGAQLGGDSGLSMYQFGGCLLYTSRSCGFMLHGRLL